MPREHKSNRGCNCEKMSSIESYDDTRESKPPRHRHRSLKGEKVCRTCGKAVRKCNSFVVVFSILIVILILLGAGLAFAALYTSSLSELNTDDLRTYEYQYHLRHLMWAIGAGGILAALTGIIGLIAINPKAATPLLRVIFELLLLLTAALLLILGMLVLSAIYIRRYVVDRYLRPLMTAYEHEETADPFKRLHRFQGEFQCCGLSNPPNPYSHLNGNPKGPLPWSCCLSYTKKDYSDLNSYEQTKELANKIIERGCNRAVTNGAHSMYCDQISPELADWAFASGIEALAVSLYCIFLIIISCIARRVEYGGERGS